jgi:hypothetical protein
LDQWENLVYSAVLEIFENSKEVLRTPSPLLPPLALCSALCTLQHCRPSFSAVPRHLLLPSPPRVVPQPEHRSSSPLLASARLPRPSPLLPELLPSDSSPPPWQMPASPPFPRPALVTVSSFGSSPSHSSRFPLLRTPRAPNTTTASFLHSGDSLLAVGCRRPPPIAHYNPPGKFPLTSLTLPSHSPWPDLHRNYLAVDPLLAGKLHLRPSSVQFDYTNSFPSSCCSY